MEERGVCSTLLGLRNVMIGKNFAPETFILKFSCANEICMSLWDFDQCLAVDLCGKDCKDRLFNRSIRSQEYKDVFWLFLLLPNWTEGEILIFFFLLRLWVWISSRIARFSMLNLGSKDSAYISIRIFFHLRTTE